ncbi:hypothetical protein RQP46_006468 [Phenoliferia psychrophenolica]
MAAKTSRSQFIQKLHQLLSDSQYPSSLHWCEQSDNGSDSFEITVDDARAIEALSPAWEFRSLSSFIRQLSYYGFKRLSDRRRSSERRASGDRAFVCFAHPSGFFSIDDDSQLDKILRKTRQRKSATSGPGRKRKASSTSSDHESQSQSPNDQDDPEESSYPHGSGQPLWPSHHGDQVASYARMPAQPQNVSRARPPLPLHLNLSSQHYTAERGSDSWEGRQSPYPSPLQHLSPHHHATSPASHLYSASASYFHPAPYPSLSPSNFSSHNSDGESLSRYHEQQHHERAPTYEPSGSHHHASGVLRGVPPSPTDSHYASSHSPSNSEPEESRDYSQSARPSHVYAGGPMTVKIEDSHNGRLAYYDEKYDENYDDYESQNSLPDDSDSTYQPTRA